MRLRRHSRTPAQRGQVLVIFAASIMMWVGMCAVVVDIAWYWANNLRMQRAADAAALAGVVYLPGDPTAARAAARSEATKNGYSNGVGGTTVTVDPDPANERRIVVTVTGTIGTFFMRAFGIDQLPASRDSRAEYVLPVPMGSPENYYGVFGRLRTPGGGTTTYDTTTGDTGWLDASATKGTAAWTSPGNVYASDDAYASSSATTTASRQAWGNFSVSLPSGASVTGIEVGMEASITGTGSAANCQIQADLSWNNGTSYTTGTGTGVQLTPALTITDPSAPYYVLGADDDLWGRSSWSSSQLNDTNFRVRVRNVKTSCATTITHRIDLLRVRVHYEVTTSTFIPDANITDPYGASLTPRGYWGTMLSQGAEDINGDAYLPYYETRTSYLNGDYDATRYYDYAVVIPDGAVGGEVWIYDPVFCATNGSGAYGTGDRWFSGSTAFSSFYDVYDTHGTLYDLDDDTLVATSGGLFRSIQASDQTLDGPTGVSSCAVGDVTDPADGRYWHNRWWQLGSGLTAGTYRVRTSTTDPLNAAAQLSTNGHNSFAIWSRATGGSPRIYGIGAMEAFSPLDGGTASEFYLAQIEALHAGKTIVIDLWDPGDTGSLPATLQILRPDGTGYTAASMTWRAKKGTASSGASNCNSLKGTNVTTITTNTGGSSNFNGCWVTIEIKIPADYSAPTPPGEAEPGWWKIKYAMGGTASTASFDVTTWQVEIRGNPVHLVLP